MFEPVTVATTNVPVLEDRHETWAWVEDTLVSARQVGSSLVLLPELLFPGYQAISVAPTLDQIRDFHRQAESTGGPTITKMAELALKIGCDIVVGFLEERDGAYYNSAAWVSQGKLIGLYRKTHLYAFESRYMQAGHEWSVFDTAWGRVGLLIGHDKEFPEAARTLKLHGADWFLIPAAWAAGQPETAVGDQQVFRAYDIARAIENNGWIVSSNYTGMSQGLPYLGHAAIVSPSGHVAAQLGDAPGWTASRIDANLVAPAYAAIDVERERRPDLYQASHVTHFPRP